MQQNTFLKLIRPTLFLFVLITAVCIGFANRLESMKVDHNVVLGGNLLLFVLAFITLAMHIQAAKNTNPNVLVRSIMGAMLIKMMALGIAAIAYLLLAKQNRNIPAIAIVMGLYIVYMVAEVRAALLLNKKQ